MEKVRERKRGKKQSQQKIEKERQRKEEIKRCV